jgi:hypothetical protein
MIQSGDNSPRLCTSRMDEQMRGWTAPQAIDGWSGVSENQK